MLGQWGVKILYKQDICLLPLVGFKDSGQKCTDLCVMFELTKLNAEMRVMSARSILHSLCFWCMFVCTHACVCTYICVSVTMSES
jgi:hypothetical protein